jgi:hypothetical protein
MKRKKEKLPASLAPWPCVILAIDPAKLSGWCLMVCRDYALSGIGNTHEARTSVVRLAKTSAEANGLPLVVVAETWSRGGPFGGARSMAGLGAGWGRWDEAILAEIGKGYPLVRVLPQVWRAATFGAGGTSEALKLRSKTFATTIAGRVVDSDDEADAIGIAVWARNAGEVGEELAFAHLEKHGFDTGPRRWRNALKRDAAKARKAAKAVA